MRPLKFSKKQRRVLTWWRPSSPDSGYDAILCEGAVTGLSFFCWAMTCFAQKSFALCGKSVPAVRRNLWQELRPILREMGFQIRERLSQNRIDISLGRRRNTFYLFGGLDERSAALVQGITLAGALLDEAALMPRSFVDGWKPAVVLLQPGEPRPLVLPGVGSEGGREKRAAAVLYHAGQPRSVPRDHPAL